MNKNSSTDEGQMYRLNPYLELIIKNKNEVELVASLIEGPHYKLRDDETDNILSEILKELRGGSQIAELTSTSNKNQNEIVALLDSLREKDIVQRYDEEERTARSPRGYLNLTHFRRQKLEEKTDISNICIIATQNVYELFQSIWPWSHIDLEFLSPHELHDSTKLFGLIEEKSEMTVCIVQEPFSEKWRKCMHQLWNSSIPHFVGSIFGLDTFIGPAIIPSETACYDCFLRGISKNYSSELSLMSTNPDHERNVLSEVFFSVCISNLILHITHYCFNGYTLLAGRIEYMNLLSLDREASRVFRYPYCDICGQEQQGSVTRPVFNSED